MPDRAAIGRNNKARGKADEREVARRLGTTRHPADTGGGEDLVELDGHRIQVKGGKTVATQIMRDGLDAARSVTGTGQLAALAIVDRRAHPIRYWICFDLDAWADYNGYGPKAGGEE